MQGCRRRQELTELMALARLTGGERTVRSKQRDSSENGRRKEKSADSHTEKNIGRGIRRRRVNPDCDLTTEIGVF